MLDFWRRLDEAGQLVHDFTDPGLDTGFLADVYADLSDHARKTYALVQTPGFVADLILDHTVKPALDTFGPRGLRVIEPGLRLRHVPSRNVPAADASMARGGTRR